MYVFIPYKHFKEQQEKSNFTRNSCVLNWFLSLECALYPIFRLQKIDPRLIARAHNRLIPTSLTTSDNNVTHYRWVPIDVDPVRPAGIPSSDSELNKALMLRDNIKVWMMERYDLPEPISAMSGNGGHLLFRLPEDLPVNDESKAFIHNILETVAEEFDTDDVEVDRVVFNPARIWKLYGTRTGKGDPLPGNEYREARPHRVSYIDNMGEV